MSRPDEDGREGGFALFVVLAFLLLAAAVATPFFTMARQYAFLSRNVAHGVEERALSQAILAVAGQRYLEVVTRGGKPPIGVRCRTGGSYAALAISFQSHAGLIDLNAAPPELLQLGFLALGADAQASAALARKAEAYRTVVAEGTPEEVDPGVIGGLKHAPFVSTSEVLDLQLPSMVRPEDVGRVFTVYSDSKTLDGALAAPPIRLILRNEPSAGVPVEPSPSDTVAPFTVELDLTAPRGDALRASAVYVPDKETGIVRRAGAVATPMTGAGILEADPGVGEEGPEPLDCAKFFDRGSLAMISELTQ